MSIGDAGTSVEGKRESAQCKNYVQRCVLEYRYSLCESPLSYMSLCDTHGGKLRQSPTTIVAANLPPSGTKVATRLADKSHFVVNLEIVTQSNHR